MTSEAKDKLGRWVVLGSLVIALVGTARGLVADASGVGEYKAGFENICKSMEKLAGQLEKNDTLDQEQGQAIAELKISSLNANANTERLNRTMEEIQRDIKTILARMR